MLIFEKKSMSFNQFITEKKDNENKGYGCLMLYFSFPKMKEIHEQINEDDLYVEEEGHGLETEPHTTLLYGLHYDEIEDDDIFDAVMELVPEETPTLELYNVSLFENDKFDVLKFDVKSKLEEYSKDDDVLFQMNNALTNKFPFTTDYPDYHPHTTIAYLKPGKGKEYVKLFKDEVYEVNPKEFVYSKPNDDSDGDDKIQSKTSISTKDDVDKLNEDSIPGGKGDNLNPEDVNKNELEVGEEVQLEHTDEPEKAEEIALDHLEEDPVYYSKLVSSGLVDEPRAIKKAEELLDIK